ncbi:MAG: TrkA C-terminal domain-containing protein [Bacteroidales bacterium]|nr:TrkA C-terminal domain-containing protein [Bacteroidales bacterium]
MEKQSKPIRSSINKQFSQHDIHIENVNVSPDSRFIGKTLSEMALRKKYGINIVKIKRGHTIINLPSGNDYIYPHDQILILGTDEQICVFKEVVATSVSVPDASKESKIDLVSFILEADCPLTNKRICDISLRDNELMIVTIERNGEIFLNPDPDLTLKANDLIWVVRNKKKIQHVLKKA